MPVSNEALATAYREIFRADPVDDDLAPYEASATIDAAIVAMTSEAQATHRVLTFYDVFYGRTPDSPGLDFWTGVVSDDPEFADSDLAAAFFNADEFTNLYGDMSTEETVTALYRNVLDREPEAAGLAFWTDVVEADNGFSLQELGLAFATAPETGTVYDSLNNLYLRDLARGSDAVIDNVSDFDPGATLGGDGIFFDSVFFGQTPDVQQGDLSATAPDDLNIGAGGSLLVRNATVSIGDDFNTYSETRGTTAISGPDSVVTLRDGKNGDSANFRVGINENGADASAFMRIDDGATVIIEDRTDTGERLRVGYNEGAYFDSGGVVPGGKNIDGTLVINGSGTRVTVEGENGELRVGAIGFGDDDAIETTADRTATGYLSIEDGAKVEVGFFAYAGSNNGTRDDDLATGTIVVQGEGSVLDIGSEPAVGPNGFLGVADGEDSVGALIVRDGGQVILREGDTFGGSLHFAGRSDEVGGEASGLLTGEGSQILAERGGVQVGRNGGHSNFTISDGARFYGQFFSSGRSGEGHTVVDGEGTMVNLSGAEPNQDFGAFLTVGRDAVGSFTVSSGADVLITGDGGTFPGFQAGRNEGGVGVITVTGAGSTITVDGADNVEADGGETGFIRAGRDADSSGTINVLDGATIINESTGRLIVAQNDGSLGEVTVSGEGSVFDFGATAFLSQDAPQERGTSIVTISDGGILRGGEVVNNGILDITNGGMFDADLVQDNLLRSSGGIEEILIDGDLTYLSGGVGFDFANAGTDSFVFDTYNATGAVDLQGILFIVAPSLAALQGETATLINGASLTTAQDFSVQFIEFAGLNTLDTVDPSALVDASNNAVALGFTTDATSLTVDFGDVIA